MITLAKVFMEDDTVISSGHLVDKMEEADRMFKMQMMIDSDRAFVEHRRKRHKDVDKLKTPNGIDNRHRINNLCTYDLLVHIQQTLSLSNRCIIELITNEDHRCLNTNDTIQHRIHQFAGQFVDDELREKYPRSVVRYKVPGTESDFDYRDETDDEWFDRLCHLIMHRDHPAKFQMIKCEECLYEWLNSSKW